MSSSAWQTELYAFPTDLSLSKNAAIDDILAEIPVFSLSLLGFGALTFFLIMRKIHLSAVLILSSVLFGFFAAILDLAQTVVRVHKSQLGESIESIVPLIIAREVLFAIQVSLRYMAFWAFVAEAPRGEALPVDRRASRPTTFLAMGNDAESRHSGEWARWGFVGVFWRWMLLVMALVILVLQILWRDLKEFNRFSTVYDVDATLEIVASAIFIVKLFLNAAIARTPSRSKTLLQYTPMVFALFVNLGLAVGNLLVFAFTESIVGRFLLAIEDYVIILHLLVWILYPVETSVETPVRPRTRQRRSSFSGLRITSRESAFGAPLMAPIQTDIPPQLDRPTVASRLSTTSRLSSWILTRTDALTGRGRPALERDEQHLWDKNDVERYQSPTSPNNEKTASVYYQASSPATDEPKQSARWQDPVYTSIMAGSPQTSSRASVMNELAITSPPIVTEDRLVIAPIPEESPERPSSAVPSTIPSYYIGRADSESPDMNPPMIPTISTGSQSPIYGLNGTMRGGRFSPAPPVRSPLALSPSPALATEADITSARSSGLDNLLREQDELEKSIAALKMFAPTSPSAYSNNSTSQDRASKGLTVRQSQYDTNSVSAKSDFSLSNFPQPPDVEDSEVPDMPSSTANSQKNSLALDPGRAGTQSITFTLVPPRMPVVTEESILRQSVPHSTRDSSEHLEERREGLLSRGARFDSGGTQYDVTSFIGGLTIPSEIRQPSSGLSPANEESEPGSATGSAISATIVTAQRQQYSNATVAQQLLVGRGGGSPPASEAVNTHSRSASDDQVAGGRVPLVRNVAVPTALRPSTSNPNLGGRPIGLPTRPNQFTSKVQLFDEATAYESPRPAPMVIQPLAPGRGRQ